MKALSLFSGIGGIDLAAEWAGIETVAFCEREPFPQKVLKKHWPDVPIYDDVCTLTKERLDADGIGTIDLIHGGYPCQPFSVAGNREGAEDDRHLWPEVFRLIQTVQPRWFVGENVAGHVTLGLDIVLADLESIGYAWEAFVIPAVSVDARHRRDRIFIVAHTTSTGLPIRGRSNRSEGNTKTGTRVESEPERCGENVADTNGAGMEGSQNTGSIEGSWENSHKHAIRLSEGANRGAAQSSMGGKADGIPGIMDRNLNAWRDDWEDGVPRVATGVKNRVGRLKALGNSVVPQQIYPILAAIKQIDDTLKEVM